MFLCVLCLFAVHISHCHSEDAKLDPLSTTKLAKCAFRPIYSNLSFGPLE